jgi:hypothetical protein
LPNTYGTKFANCNAGEVVVGGGFALNSGVTLYNFTASGSSWGRYVWNHNSSSTAASFWAECLTLSGAHSSFIAPTSNVGSSPSATANCPSGSSVSGGGFAANQNSSIYTMDANGNGWQPYVTPSGTGMNAYAECVTFS